MTPHLVVFGCPLSPDDRTDQRLPAWTPDREPVDGLEVDEVADRGSPWVI